MAADTACAEVRETHVSRLFFSADRVHKILKPIETGYLDHRTASSRLQALRREYELNRRLAPDVYLGVSELIENGAQADAMLTMRRLPDHCRLTNLVGTPAFEPALRAVAKSVAAFHARLDPVTAPTLMAEATGLLSLWTSSFDEMATDIGTVIDAAEFGRVQALVHDYLEHAGPLFEQRRTAGLVRDGHGDLTAEDIFILGDGPLILDCLAFADDLRVSDVLADISFLVMDVHRLAGVEPAQRLMAWYCEFSGEHHPGSLAHHYVAYRAHIRAKVELLRHRQGVEAAAEQARAYHRLAADHLTRSRLRVVIVGGGPGSGKTTLAHELGQKTGWLVLGSDELRKDLAGVAHETHFHDAPGTGQYTKKNVAETYRHLLQQADAALSAGESVILDASWCAADNRTLAAELARDRGAELIELRCHVSIDEAKRRVSRRRTNEATASDARPDIVEFLDARFDPWPTATVVDTSSTPDVAIDVAIGVAWRHRTARTGPGPMT